MLFAVAGNKTAKRHALGTALTNLRTENGLTLRALAEKAGYEHAGTLSRWEKGERTPHVDDVKRLLDALGVQGERREEVIALADGTDEPRWLAITLPEQRAMLSALIDFQDAAKHIVAVSPLLIPGLLQSSDYIRALMIEGGVPADELGTRVAVRVGRRDVITRRNPANLTAIIGEAALRQVIGSRQIMAGQLRYLNELGALPNVEIRVLPFDSGWHPALEGPFTLIEGEQPVVNLENRRSGLFLHEEADLELYRDAVRFMLGGESERKRGEPGQGRKVAMSPAASAELIAEIANEMETTA
ncbi:helix-turn-helix transcriptional regulator [Amycolatopsis sp. NPDC006131]|uniref:helix-turn-helix domain-containing protein n=1 Tax=Amycolatopsis sp. NPDC006131 TaxID=3156731 RepID=UPI0033A969E1